MGNLLNDKTILAIDLFAYIESFSVISHTRHIPPVSALRLLRFRLISYLSGSDLHENQPPTALLFGFEPLKTFEILSARASFSAVFIIPVQKLVFWDCHHAALSLNAFRLRTDPPKPRNEHVRLIIGSKPNKSALAEPFSCKSPSHAANTPALSGGLVQRAHEARRLRRSKSCGDAFAERFYVLTYVSG